MLLLLLLRRRLWLNLRRWLLLLGLWLRWLHVWLLRMVRSGRIVSLRRPTILTVRSHAGGDGRLLLVRLLLRG